MNDELDIIGEYRNGTYDVTILDDGTKIRYALEKFDAEFPECIDMNITDYCGVGCPFCYRNCTKEGKHADVPYDLLDTIHPYTEIALGGGSPIEHPKLEEFLHAMRERRIIANITVHWKHTIQYRDKLVDLMERKLLNGVGISINEFDPAVATFAKKHKNCVIHLIAGVTDAYTVRNYLENGNKILILGYKELGRGATMMSDEVRKQIDGLKDELKEILEDDNLSGVISFDNLAINQLNVRDALGEERFNEIYMGDDGVDGELTSASMYIDLVAGIYSVNSLTEKTHPIGGTVKEMFQNLKKENTNGN